MEERKSEGGLKPLMTDWMLRAETGPLAGKLFPVGLRTTLGRALHCDISIPEGGLSREHAELRVDGNQLVVVDLDSSNGTYHNGERVKQGQPKHGDVLSFDTVQFRVVGPANDMDRTMISAAPLVRPRTVAPAAAEGVPAMSVAGAGGAASKVALPPSKTPPPVVPKKAGIPAWVVLMTLLTLVVLIFVVAAP